MSHRFGFKRAICYSGFRDGQSPDLGKYPSVEEIRSDLMMLKDHWSALRLYACDEHARRVLTVIREENLDFTVMLGAYIGAELSNPLCPWGGVHAQAVLTDNRRRNVEELARAARWANEYQDIVDVVSVGNEATVDWTDHLVDPKTVERFARELKAKIPQPVTFCENYVPWLDKLVELAGTVDLISIHTYPVWEYKTIDEALSFTIENYRAVKEMHPDKPVIVTEAGWTTQSNGEGVPKDHVSEAAQARYLSELLEWARDEDVLVYVFEAFDENWKGSDHPLEPEKHWGIYNASREPKLAVQLSLG